MPKVPIYNEPEETLRALPNVQQVAPQSALPQVGAALQQAGGVASGIAVREQQLENADRLFRTEATLRDEYLKFETSLRERRGQNAWGVTDDVTTWFDERGTKLLEGLDNDEQRRLFEPTFARMRTQGVDAASRYESQERRVSLEESARASIASSINLAAARHDDPAAVDGARDDILRRVHVQAQFNGWSPERVAAEEEERLTQLHTGVLRAMVDADPKRAEEYYAANKDEIAGTAHDELDQLVRVGGLRATAQKESDALMALNLTETETLKRVREDFEGEERDAIEARVKVQFNDQRAAQQQRESELTDAAWKLFAEGGGISAIPSAMLAELDGRTLLSMRREEAGGSVDTNWETYYTLQQEFIDDPAKFRDPVQTDLRKYFNELAPAQRAQVLGWQRTAPEQLPDVATLAQQLGVAHNLLGLDETVERGKFDSAVQTALSAEQNAKGKELTFDERQQVIDRMMMQGEVIGGGFFGLTDPDRRAYQVVGTPDEKRFAVDVSQLEGFNELTAEEQEELRRRSANIGGSK